jgi:hypothetical protein
MNRCDSFIVQVTGHCAHSACVDTPPNALTRQLLEWLAARPRTREETLEAWRTTCPRHTPWEDACLAGLVEPQAGGPWIGVSAKGRRLLQSPG